MSRRRVPVARVTTVAAVVVGALVIGRGVSGPHFRSLRPGLELAGGPLDARRPRWREIAQSFMLFDRTGTLRIRRTSQTANRTVVAEDRDGRLLVITTEGAYTLHEFASLLRAWPLRITQAMSMDGGEEAMLCVKVGRFRYASFGRWDGEPDSDGKSDRAPLPAVIAVTAE